MQKASFFILFLFFNKQDTYSITWFEMVFFIHLKKELFLVKFYPYMFFHSQHIQVVIRGNYCRQTDPQLSRCIFPFSKETQIKECVNSFLIRGLLDPSHDKYHFPILFLGIILIYSSFFQFIVIFRLICVYID